MQRSVVVLVALTALAGSACGGGGGNSSSSNAGGCTADTATDLTGDNPFTIGMHDLVFYPSCLSAKNNSTIKLVNQDFVNHTFTITGTGVDVLIEAGQTVTKPGANLAPATYQFHCTIHPQMMGTIIVFAG